MALKLMYITNNPIIAQIAETAGVDCIFVDMEYIGKSARQGNMDTVKSHHTLDDVKRIADSIETAELLVRVNPIHAETSEYASSEAEINESINCGAKKIMLPYFKTVKEVESLVKYVDGRAKVMPLIETPEAVAILDDLLRVDGVDEWFIGLNDLSIGYCKRFMFELLSDGTVEDICYKIHRKGKPFGFGGIASKGKGQLHSEKIIVEHYRLGSTSAILSRSFCNVNLIKHMGVISATFVNGIREIREIEAEAQHYRDFFIQNSTQIADSVSVALDDKNISQSNKMAVL